MAIGELVKVAPQWRAGWNVPGYMPEDEPIEAATWHEARDALLWEVERWDETDDADSAVLDGAAAELKAATPDQPVEVRCGRYVLFIARIEP